MTLDLPLPLGPMMVVKGLPGGGGGGRAWAWGGEGNATHVAAANASGGGRRRRQGPSSCPGGPPAHLKGPITLCPR